MGRSVQVPEEDVPPPVRLEQKRAEATLTKLLARASKGGPFADIVRLTPALAALLLTQNPSNRKLNRAELHREISDMRRGDWRLNGETIIVADSGELNDGQHRCTAIVKSGVTIETFMVFGVPRQTRETVDQGLVKTMGHRLTMRDTANAGAVARVARLVWQYENIGAFDRHDIGPTPAQLLALISDRDDLLCGLHFGKLARKWKMASATNYAAVHYILARVNPKEADRFSASLTEWSGLEFDSPIFILGKRLIGDYGKLRSAEVAGLVIKAWNAWREGEKIDRLRVVIGEKFPIAI